MEVCITRSSSPAARLIRIIRITGDTQGYTGYLTEEYGAILAFNSLIDPSSSNRILYAQYARNMLMYAIIRLRWARCPALVADPMFATYNQQFF